ncbi:hypothetical protein [Bradyrhizobium sp. AZCC 1610]|uniref:hypothetical protein n=1 Tax=Bradyrhizobium sp. AZCC 1610 TaxID=3117020 RepID=UPI002FF2B78D
MASMSGLDFVRAIFDGRLPAPPIMQNVEPFDSTAETGHATAEARITDAKGRLLAHATTTCLVFEIPKGT